MKRVFGKLSKMKGSILAYTLILLGIVLTASMGMFMSSMRDLRSVGTQNRSMQAFQIANSGSEMAVSALKKNPSNLKDLAENKIGGASCSGGEITKTSYLGGDTRLSFFDDAGTKIADCDDASVISTIASVKSVGTFKETARAVEVAVAAGVCPATGGGMVIMSESSDKDGFDAGAITQLVDNERVKITGALCIYSINSIHMVFGVDEYVRFRSGGGLALGGGHSLATSATGDGTFYCPTTECFFNTVSGMEPCIGGWKIYGECPVN